MIQKKYGKKIHDIMLELILYETYEHLYIVLLIELLLKLKNLTNGSEM